MHDALRINNTTLAQFKWHGPAIASRLDRFYVTTSIKPESCNAKHLSVSGHSLVGVTVAINHCEILVLDIGKIMLLCTIMSLVLNLLKSIGIGGLTCN